MFSPRSSISGFMPSLLSSPLPPYELRDRRKGELREPLPSQTVPVPVPVAMEPAEYDRRRELRREQRAHRYHAEHDDGNVSDNEDSGSASMLSTSASAPSLRAHRTCRCAHRFDDDGFTDVRGNLGRGNANGERDREFREHLARTAPASRNLSSRVPSDMHMPAPAPAHPAPPHTPRTHLPTPARTPSPTLVPSSRSSPRLGYGFPHGTYDDDIRSHSGACILHSSPYDNGPSPSSKPSVKSVLTSFLLSWFYKYIVPYLPEDLAAIARNPPDLSRPETLVVLFRAVAPYTQFLLVLVVLYVVWAVVTGFIGYLSRFLRFCARIGPVIAIIAWIMAASGQGGIDVIYEALKQYAGLAPEDGYPRGAPPRRTPGWEAPADHYAKQRSRDQRARRRSSGSDSSYWDARNARAVPPTRGRNARGQQQDPLAAVFEDGLGATVQGFVRQAVARAAGLDWLMGERKEDDKKRERR